MKSSFASLFCPSSFGEDLLEDAVNRRLGNPLNIPGEDGYEEEEIEERIQVDDDDNEDSGINSGLFDEPEPQEALPRNRKYFRKSCQSVRKWLE